MVHGASRNSVTPLRSLSKDFEAGALDLYEKRARSRRKFAIREYDDARAALAVRQRVIDPSLQKEWRPQAITTRSIRIKLILAKRTQHGLAV
jgi:hypothetical protein